MTVSFTCNTLEYLPTPVYCLQQITSTTKQLLAACNIAFWSTCNMLVYPHSILFSTKYWLLLMVVSNFPFQRPHKVVCFLFIYFKTNANLPSQGVPLPWNTSNHSNEKNTPKTPPFLVSFSIKITQIHILTTLSIVIEHTLFKKVSSFRTSN